MQSAGFTMYMILNFYTVICFTDYRNGTVCEKQTNLEMEDKLTRLLEIFPQRSRSELLEVTAFFFFFFFFY